MLVLDWQVILDFPMQPPSHKWLGRVKTRQERPAILVEVLRAPVPSAQKSGTWVAISFSACSTKDKPRGSWQLMIFMEISTSATGNTTSSLAGTSMENLNNP